MSFLVKEFSFGKKSAHTRKANYYCKFRKFPILLLCPRDNCNRRQVRKPTASRRLSLTEKACDLQWDVLIWILKKSSYYLGISKPLPRAFFLNNGLTLEPNVQQLHFARSWQAILSLTFLHTNLPNSSCYAFQPLKHPGHANQNPFRKNSFSYWYYRESNPGHPALTLQNARPPRSSN